MGSKRQGQADRALVAAYHEARLGELVDWVAAAIDAFRAGEQDAYEVDETIHQYRRAAQELWKFCWGAGVGTGIELRARLLQDMAAEGKQVDWWQRGTPPERGRRG